MHNCEFPEVAWPSADEADAVPPGTLVEGQAAAAAARATQPGWPAPGLLPAPLWEVTFTSSLPRGDLSCTEEGASKPLPCSWPIFAGSPLAASLGQPPQTEATHPAARLLRGLTLKLLPIPHLVRCSTEDSTRDSPGPALRPDLPSSR